MARSTEAISAVVDGISTTAMLTLRSTASHGCAAFASSKCTEWPSSCASVNASRGTPRKVIWISDGKPRGSGAQ